MNEMLSEIILGMCQFGLPSVANQVRARNESLFYIYRLSVDLMKVKVKKFADWHRKMFWQNNRA